jgi:hypothetical protein
MDRNTFGFGISHSDPPPPPPPFPQDPAQGQLLHHLRRPYGMASRMFNRTGPRAVLFVGAVDQSVEYSNAKPSLKTKDHGISRDGSDRYHEHFVSGLPNTIHLEEHTALYIVSKWCLVHTNVLGPGGLRIGVCYIAMLPQTLVYHRRLVRSPCESYCRIRRAH